MGLHPEEKLRGPLGIAAIMAKAIIRRLVVAASSKGLWNLEGFEDEIEPEVPVFSGIGFYSRPRDADTSDAECVVVKIGGKTAHPIIVATRDETLRQLLAAIRDLFEDETAMFNSKARVHILKDGTVEVDDGSGAVALATKADVDAVEAFQKLHFDTVAGHKHTALGSPPVVGTGSGTGFSVPSAAGTSVLKGK